MKNWGANTKSGQSTDQLPSQRALQPGACPLSGRPSHSSYSPSLHQPSAEQFNDHPGVKALFITLREKPVTIWKSRYFTEDRHIQHLVCPAPISTSGYIRMLSAARNKNTQSQTGGNDEKLITHNWEIGLGRDPGPGQTRSSQIQVPSILSSDSFVPDLSQGWSLHGRRMAARGERGLPFHHLKIHYYHYYKGHWKKKKTKTLHFVIERNTGNGCC